MQDSLVNFFVKFKFKEETMAFLFFSLIRREVPILSSRLFDSKQAIGERLGIASLA